MWEGPVRHGIRRPTAVLGASLLLTGLIIGWLLLDWGGQQVTIAPDLSRTDDADVLTVATVRRIQLEDVAKLAIYARLGGGLNPEWGALSGFAILREGPVSLFLKPLEKSQPLVMPSPGTLATLACFFYPGTAGCQGALDFLPQRSGIPYVIIESERGTIRIATSRNIDAPYAVTYADGRSGNMNYRGLLGLGPRGFSLETIGAWLDFYKIWGATDPQEIQLTVDQAVEALRRSKSIARLCVSPDDTGLVSELQRLKGSRTRLRVILEPKQIRFVFRDYLFKRAEFTASWLSYCGPQPSLPPDSNER
jgi:hypothetical protein